MCAETLPAWEQVRREERRSGKKNAATASWSEDRCARLRDLWATGASCRDIAAELGGGVTRNAVIGKVRRLGLPQRWHKSSKTNARFGNTKTKRRTTKPKVGSFIPGVGLPVLPHLLPGDTEALKGNAWAALPGTAPVPLAGLGDGCKWPIGEDRPYLFCNEPVSRGVYCSVHAAIAFRPLPPRPERRVKRAGGINILNLEDA